MKQRQLMNTIERTFERAQDENLGISKHFIRMSVLNGTLPSVRAGKKRLINWEHFINFINTPQYNSAEETQDGKIRPVSERSLANTHNL